MKELYSVSTEIKFNQSPFKNYTDNYCLQFGKQYIDKEEFEERRVVFNNFDELWEKVNNYSFGMRFSKRKFFGKRVIDVGFFYPLDSITITEKNRGLFPIVIANHLEDEHSIKSVSEYLSASEFCDYLKEHGINSIMVK